MAHEKQPEPFYLLLKRSKYGHDYELYRPDQVDKVNINDKTKEWHDYLLHAISNPTKITTLNGTEELTRGKFMRRRIFNELQEKRNTRIL